MDHVRDDLSAYLDGALLPERRSAVEAHLGACPQCWRALGELRSAARLIAALPAPVPSRRLVPALAPRLNWLRPVRSLSAVAAGMFVLMFMASATVDTGFRMGGGDAKSAGGRLIGGPAPAAAPAAPALEAGPRKDMASAPAVGGARGAASASPGAFSAADAQRSSTQSTPAPQVAAASASPAEQLSGAPADSRVAYGHPSAPVSLGTPWLWLALTLLSAGLALAAHRRLRAF